MQELTECTRCTRLRKHCLKIARVKRRAFQNETYWGKPISGFGDPLAQVLIVGLAPAAHGANRTGRIFTGDQSGLWLYRALHKAGFANQPESTGRDDGLKLKNAYVTCVVKCAPPDNKPTPAETKKCLPYLEEELRSLRNVQVIVALGKFALDVLWPILLAEEAKSSPPLRKPKFGHGAQTCLPGGRLLLCSFHPSQQNTFTRRLTEPAFDQIFEAAKDWLATR